ncbi:MAG: Short C-terminal domain-containing protein [Candidatus Electronema aureum]|uniref:Short C-terminal domain-containing protein n=1 Tax=Candidatus Electronema aureum TaxID=2005002 RepID=A0A521FYM3_9BACT|nr:MAG: Short C-terminal domain-containing protein [Candidatus Electronema aureum]
MGDWEFLYEMKDRGYSEDEIQDAMSSGAAPWEWDYLAKQERKAEWEKLKSLRDTGAISREEFKKRKAEMFC